VTRDASPVGPDARFAPASHVHCRRFDDELVVLDLESGDYFALNETAARMWERFSGGSSPREVAAELASESGDSLERITSDCLAFAARLLDEGWVTLR
jgi:hypothetical protein